MDKTVLFGKILELVPIKAADPVVPGGEPEIPLAVFCDVFNAHSGQAIGQGISLPGARAVEWLDHKKEPCDMDERKPDRLNYVQDRLIII